MVTHHTLTVTEPDIPKVVGSLLTRIWWSNVSNAADRSRRDSTETFLLSALVSNVLVTWSNAVSVEWCFLYADRNMSSRPSEARWF